ncbi:hypothetical protein EQ828_09445 [Ectopseudomonas mendocina]|nr:hypothetical protein [Pseudomonas mendocina]TRO23092.1 hypothetical protein EQ828_09445 [Pseudomonas mendocina]
MDSIDYILSRPLSERLAEGLRAADEIADSTGYDVRCVESMAAILLLLCQDRSSYEAAAEMAGAARLDLISIEQPEIAAIAIRAVSFAFGAGLAAARGHTVGKIQRDAKKLTGLAAQKMAKDKAIERAQTIAAKLWEADAAQEIRLGEMADKVYRALVAEGFAESLPGTAERLKEWIKPAAPNYARKGGRRRKTPERHR